MYRDGSGKKYLGSGRNPVFSPDGNMIAFVNGDVGGTPGIWKMRT
jgi:Tol biopolymer transport system component